jgi:hypothetical protein
MGYVLTEGELLKFLRHSVQVFSQCPVQIIPDILLEVLLQGFTIGVGIGANGTLEKWSKFRNVTTTVGLGSTKKSSVWT